jgi:hypothetical protein
LTALDASVRDVMDAISDLGSKRIYGFKRYRERIAEVLDEISQSEQPTPQLRTQLVELQREVENVRVEWRVMRNDSVLNPYT